MHPSLGGRVLQSARGIHAASGFRRWVDPAGHEQGQVSGWDGGREGASDGGRCAGDSDRARGPRMAGVNQRTSARNSGKRLCSDDQSAH